MPQVELEAGDKVILSNGLRGEVTGFDSHPHPHEVKTIHDSVPLVTSEPSHIEARAREIEAKIKKLDHHKWVAVRYKDESGKWAEDYFLDSDVKPKWA